MHAACGALVNAVDSTQTDSPGASGAIGPFLALGVTMGLVTVWWERYHQFTVGSTFAIGWTSRLLIASRAGWFYAGKLLWPAHLAFSYPRWHIDPRDPLAWGWLGGGIAAAVVIWAFRKKLGRGPKRPRFILSRRFRLLGFIMEYTFRYTYVADHYQYAASIGKGLALAAAGIDKLFSRYGGGGGGGETKHSVRISLSIHFAAKAGGSDAGLVLPLVRRIAVTESVFHDEAEQGLKASR